MKLGLKLCWVQFGPRSIKVSPPDEISITASKILRLWNSHWLYVNSKNYKREICDPILVGIAFFVWNYGRILVKASMFWLKFFIWNCTYCSESPKLVCLVDLIWVLGQQFSLYLHPRHDFDRLLSITFWSLFDHVHGVIQIFCLTYANQRKVDNTISRGDILQSLFVDYITFWNNKLNHFQSGYVFF